jgi:hypothetical protein
MFLDLLKEETGCPYHMVVGFTTTYAISDLWYGGGFLRVPFLLLTDPETLQVLDRTIKMKCEFLCYLLHYFPNYSSHPV